jgi:hypothetical protein
MLSLLFILAALVIAQIVVLVPVADFLTRRLTGERPATRPGVPALAHSA